MTGWSVNWIPACMVVRGCLHNGLSFPGWFASIILTLIALQKYPRIMECIGWYRSCNLIVSHTNVHTWMPRACCGPKRFICSAVALELHLDHEFVACRVISLIRRIGDTRLRNAKSMARQFKSHPRGN